jgi:RimJ/RimL family protein N-acetyltransferase
VIRFECLVSPKSYTPSGRVLPGGLVVRAPTADDRHGLASLMMDAYVGTIDYEGETLDQALEEVAGYFDSEALLEVSWVAVTQGTVQSAVLVSMAAGVPLVGYVMTRAEMKNQGVASGLLDMSVEAIWDAGYGELRAFITDGNVPSEIIFKRAGFEVIATYGDD